MMKKINAFFEIIRPINVAFTFLVVLISIIICSENFTISLSIILASLAAAIVAASGNVINDYFDFEIDKINRPDRVLPKNLITKKEAIIYYSILVIASLLISITISSSAFFVVVITIAILFFYSKFLKTIPLIGNVSVALCTALAFVFGGVIAENIEVSIIPAIFAFLVNLVREILKDIQDLDGDKKLGLNTFPIKYGLKKSVRLLTVLSALLVLSTFYPYFTKLYNIEYFIVVLFFVNLPIIYFIKEIHSENFMRNISKLSVLLKAVMLFGLLAIYLGVN